MRSMRRHIRISITASIPLLLIVLLLGGCGDAPTTATDWVGNLQVLGTLQGGQPADSLLISLDGDTLGYLPNPHTFENLIAGEHFLGVYTVARYENDTLEYFCQPKTVSVNPGQTTVAEFSLITDIPESPYPGYVAPDFALYDLDSNLVSLSGLNGKIVLLYFFESG